MTSRRRGEQRSDASQPANKRSFHPLVTIHLQLNCWLFFTFHLRWCRPMRTVSWWLISRRGGSAEGGDSDVLIREEVRAGDNGIYGTWWEDDDEERQTKNWRKKDDLCRTVREKFDLKPTTAKVWASFSWMFSFYIKSIINNTTYYFSLHFRYRTGQTENKLYKIYYVLLLLSPERSQTLLYCQFESTLPSMYLNIYWYIIVI